MTISLEWMIPQNQNTMKMSVKVHPVPVFLFLLMNFPGLHAGSYMKYGKIETEDLKMSQYTKDTSADALILGDIQQVKIVYNNLEGFQMVLYRHTRIKIFNQNGYNWANQTIRFYESPTITENITSLRGCTYYLEDGKEVSVKMKNESEFTEDLSEHWRACRFTLPAIKPGAVIEYSYLLTSDYLTRLPDWQYQYRIPVVHSEMTVEIPEFFNYKQLSSGYVPVTSVEHSGGQANYSYSNTTQDRLGNRETSLHQGIYQTNIMRMEAGDVPAFIEEPMITTVQNYLAAINFELSTTKFPGEMMKNHTTTWEDINKTLMESDNFGGQLRSGLFLNSFAAAFENGDYSDMEKAQLALLHIKSQIAWNGSNSIYPEKTLRNSYTEGSGNVADLNLNLVVLLDKMGLEADPVILSTRSNGILNPFYPQLTKFNYVVARVKIGDRYCLMDATERNCPTHILPVRCLNGQGRLISKNRTDWVDLESHGCSYEEACLAQLALDDRGIISGSMQHMKKDYAAYLTRNTVQKKTSLDDYIRELESENAGLEIRDYNFRDLDSVQKPIIYSFDVEIRERAMVAGDFIYLNPMLFEQVESNPFKLKERKYPVDYAYPIKRSFILNLEIPDGYEIEEIPDGLTLEMPEQSATYSYVIRPAPGRLQLLSKLDIRKSVFYYDEYELLQVFYDKLVEKQAEPIVLKRIASPQGP